ncbi:MAG: ABC transporter permease [Pseudomonadota bacterium]
MKPWHKIVGDISILSLRVWRRNLLVLRSGWLIQLVPPIVEPVLYVLAFGLGLGGMIGMVTYEGNSVSYLLFMAPGVIAITIMWWAYLETTYGSFVRMEYQKTFQSMLATPLLIEDVIAGEWLWGATKAIVATLLMTLMLTLMGLVHWPSGLWILPVTILGGLVFSAMGLITSALCPRIDLFNLPIFLLLMPMFVFSGTFFPIEILPSWALKVAYILPLTHVSILLRGACLSRVPDTWIVSSVYLIVASVGLSVLSFVLMYRRIVK